MQISGSVWVRMDMRCQEGVKKVSRRCQGGVKLETYVAMLCKRCCMAVSKVLNGCLKGTVWRAHKY